MTEANERKTVTEELTERGYERFDDPNEPISQLKELIARGEGAKHVRFVLTIRDQDEGARIVEGSVAKVYQELVALEKAWVAKSMEQMAEKMKQLEWTLSAENRALAAADNDPITPANEAHIEEWVAKALRHATGVREKLAKNEAEFGPELKAMDAQIARIMSMTRQAAPVKNAGAGRLRDLLGFTEDNLDDNAAHNMNEDARSLIHNMTGKPVIKAVEDIMNESFPGLVQAFYPRIYENVGRYNSPRDCAIMLANAVAETLRYGAHRASTAYRLLMPGLAYLRERRMPMFFIAPDLLEAVLRTDFDDDINWRELSLPYETGVLVLPKGALIHPTDGEIAMLIWSRLREGDHASPWPGVPRPQLPQDSFVILAACVEKMIWFDSIFTSNVRSIVRLRNLFYREPGAPIPAATKSNQFDSNLNEEDSEFIEQMGVVIFGTILAMNARPQLVERGQLLKRVGGGGDKPAREFWSPNVIGGKYKIKREVPKIVDRKFVTSAREHGTHASPRMHWRRGHYRQQPVGPGRKERKQIWIEPCLIGAGEDE